MTTSTSAPRSAASSRTPLKQRVGGVLRARETGIAVLIVVVFVAATAKNEAFASANSVQQLLLGASLIALLAVGQTMVIVTRNVDLSVGSVVGITAYVVGMSFRDNPDMPVFLGFLIGIGLGAVFGAITGMVVTVFRVPSLVVTLAGLYLIRGLDGLLVDGVIINPQSIPREFQRIGYETVLGIPVLFLLVLAVVVIAAYVMRSFRSARDLYAIGSNPAAAELAGIPSEKRVFTAFLVSGALAGLTGALFVALYAQVDVTAGRGYEFLVVAAVVVGGVAIFGGSGTVVGAALAALLLNTIDQALVASRVSGFWTDAIAGALLLGAIAFDRSLSLRIARRLRSQEGAHRDV
ncbi:ABC transporter permease [Modestobacter sp. Leaf380]|uniref:ABC transporter permease n=1 Tax=Modestobacter sp. Leaf380 TaxID=1736356 RepID=UPI0006FA9937|nr:ABC transporter permease [Modestobacter sp. Leaf380]KQS66731.1 ATPase [Modestobacter sp. Leaf380]